MKDEKYEWSLGSPPPTIDSHSLVKHRIISEYLKTYVAVLTQNPHQERLRLTLVDGFAGGGVYKGPEGERRSGSPLIMFESMAAARGLLSTQRRKDFELDVRYIFIEKNRSTAEFLRHTLKTSDYRSESFDVIQGSFDAYSGHLTTELRRQVRGTRGGRSIFLLDQYGYKDVPFVLIRRLFRALPNAEVILTISTDALIDYLGNDESSRRRLDNLGFILPLGELKALKTEERASWRRQIQFSLHREMIEKSGARFYTPFFVRCVQSHRSYWLVHLSNHHRARDVMTSLHWANANDFMHYGGAGLDMFGYDPVQDDKITGQRMLPEFSFDAAARSATHDSLMDGIPRKLSQVGSGQSMDDFFASVTNETPATSEICREAVRELCLDKELILYDKHGSRRRPGSIVRNSDHIVRSPQLRLLPSRS